MPTIRETILAALHARLQPLAALTLRDEVLPERIPAAGLIILRFVPRGRPAVTQIAADTLVITDRNAEDISFIRTTARQAPTVKELIDRFIDEHLPKLDPGNAKDQTSMLNGLVLPDYVALLFDRLAIDPNEPRDPAGR